LVQPHSARRRKEARLSGAADVDDTAAAAAAAGAASPGVPGTQRVYVKTFGCSHNTSDAEFMMGQLSSYGYHLVDSPQEADVCVINSCTVKGPSQEAFMTAVQRAKAMGRPVVVSGCVPQADRTIPGLEDVSVIGITQIDRVVEVVEQTLQGHIVRLLGKKSLPSLDLPKVRRNPHVEIIPLSTGCLGSCSYCKTKHARGKLGSYETEAILDRVRRAISEGVMEIWLTSEDTGAYGIDLATDIAALLRAVVGVLEAHPGSAGRVMVRLGMTNPPYMLRHCGSVGEVLRHPQVYEFIHVPIQSGSNDTLRHMVREYTVEDFHALVDGLKQRVPRLTVATDIICGFPTETDDDHQQTLDVIRRHKFPVLNISQFYPRPGTAAAKLKRLPNHVAKTRSGEVTSVFESYETTSWLQDTVQRVWFCEHSTRSQHTVGHTKQYVKVLVRRDEQLLGKSAFVRVTSTHKWHVLGEICQPPMDVEKGEP